MHCEYLHVICMNIIFLVIATCIIIIYIKFVCNELRPRIGRM